MRILYLIAILFFTLSSCVKWLDVTPKDIVIEGEMFKNGEGFRNALNGIYREMSSQSMYGKEMSWGMVDVMGQCYRTGTGISSTNVYYQAGYDGVYTSDNSKGMISGMWSSTYNVIANCNNLIEKITKAEPKEFRGGNLEKEMILGEATALRGFLHFDMLRLFGKAPVKGENEMAIPYFTRFKSVFEPQKTTKEILDLVIADLKKGRDLVINFDTLTVDGVDRKTWMSRKFRFSEKWG
ncbi:MAG: RagB/SusD family nutrient uptake outer membrane protein, partial [Rikenellaceae bacterium]